MKTPRLQIRDYSVSVVTHAHAHHQVVISLSGILEMEVAGRGGRVDADHAVVIASDTGHSFAATPRGRFLVLDLPASRAGGERLWDAASDGPFVALGDGTRHLTRYLAHRLSRIPGGPGLDLHASALLLDALASDLHTRDDATLPAPLARALAYIDGHLHDAIGVDDIAAAGARSASRVQALFRERLGMSPIAWLAQRRMQCAAERLTRGNDPVTRVAQQVGYQDPAAFARAFRRATGLSPRDWRARSRHPADGES